MQALSCAPMKDTFELPISTPVAAAGAVVIEVNDNPNLDIGYDDAADGGLIYEDILRFFLRRIEETPGTAAGSPGRRDV